MARRMLLALLVIAPILAFLVASEALDFSAGSRRTMETVSVSVHPGREEVAAGSEFIRFRGGSAVVLRLSEGALAEAMAARVCEILEARFPALAVSASAAVAGPFRGDGQSLADLIALVEVPDASSWVEGEERIDRLEVRVAFGDTPLRIGQEHSFGRGGAALVYSARVTSSFDGTQTVVARLDDLADAALGGLASALDGHELGAQAPTAGGDKANGGPAGEPAFAGISSDASSRPIYDGIRSDGSRESLWLVESPDPYRVALEQVEARARADAWTVRGDEDRTWLVLSRGAEEVQVLPAWRTSDRERSGDVREIMAIVRRRVGD